MSELDALFTKHFIELLHFAEKLSPNDGGDILSQAYEAIITGSRVWNREKDFVAFAKSVIDSIYKHRRLADHRRHKKTADAPNEETTADETERTPEERILMKETTEDAEMLKLLEEDFPPDTVEGKYIALITDEIVDPDEQAERLGVSVKEVKNICRRVAYAIDKIATKLGKAGLAVLTKKKIP
jgi:DNA-directed RNA polymerase specialized sigma24 family protein